MKKQILFFIFLCWAIVGSVSRGYAQDIRVLIMEGIGDCVVMVRGRYVIEDVKSGRELVSGQILKRSRVIFEDDRMHVGAQSFASRGIRIISDKDITLYLDEGRKRYRGALEILRGEKSTLNVINDLNVEDYIKGVLYHEVTDEWPMDAMKAQAIAARTYALYQIGQNIKNAFDVRTDIYSQVYGGKNAERFRTDMAVETTQGMVLMYAQKILPAYFHANAGDHTEDVRELWEHDLPPLYGVPDPYSKFGKAYEWNRNFRSKDVQEKLIAKGYALDEIKDIRIRERNRSGRVRTLSITTRSGRQILISGKDFRQAVGPNEIRSNNYEIVMQGYFFDLIGKGWGHGVGMSQWGAFEMARQGKTTEEILNFYYPGTEIQKLKDTKQAEDKDI